MGQRGRAIVVVFDAAVMIAAAFQITGGGFERPLLNIVLWGSAVAASLVAVVVMTGVSAYIAWAAIGYVLHAALLVSAEPNLVLLALAVALMPVVPRPRGSLAFGIACATLAAFAFSEVVGRL